MPLKPPYIERLEDVGDFRAWVVDGSYIRTHIDEEFTNFGQHYRFPYIPLNELWLDREAEQDERQFFIDHPLAEHRLMATGVPYEKAIVAADRQERKVGGHDYVYEFVPENEVWIDDDIEEPERPYVLLHELHERNRMAKGWTYNKAHAESSRMEYRCRHHPDELHDALIAEGWA